MLVPSKEAGALALNRETTEFVSAGLDCKKGYLESLSKVMCRNTNDLRVAEQGFGYSVLLKRKLLLV